MYAACRSLLRILCIDAGPSSDGDEQDWWTNLVGHHCLGLGHCGSVFCRDAHHTTVPCTSVSTLSACGCCTGGSVQWQVPLLMTTGLCVHCCMFLLSYTQNIAHHCSRGLEYRRRCCMCLGGRWGCCLALEGVSGGKWAGSGTPKSQRLQN